MRNRFLFILLLAAFALVITSGVRDINSNAAPLGSTGAPGENSCAKSTCHAGSAINSGTALLNIDFNNSTYQANGVYNITVSLQQTDILRFGFQMLALNSNNESTGTFIITDSTRTQTQEGIGVYEGRNYITYKYAGTEPYFSGLGRWTFQWKAPATYQGDVTFYAAAVAANNDATDAGDSVYTKQLSIQGDATGFESSQHNQLGVNVFPNPASASFNVHYIVSKTSDTHITLSDMLTQNIYASVSRVDNAGEQNAAINTSQLPSGIYLLNIVSDNKAGTQKVVIAK